MQVSGRYRVDSIAFFNFLARAFCHDYRENTGQDLMEDDVAPGIQYTKTFGNKGESQVQVTLRQFEIPTTYVAMIKSNRGQLQLSYQLTSLSDGTVQIDYSETMLNSGLISRMNQGFMQWLMGKSLTLRMQAQLDQIVTSLGGAKYEMSESSE